MPPNQTSHSDEMFQEYGHGLAEEQHNLVYAYAWQEGHSAGFSEVEYHYVELAELARKLLNTAVK